MNLRIDFKEGKHYARWAKGFKHMLRRRFGYTDVTYQYESFDNTSPQSIFIQVEAGIMENVTANNMEAVNESFILPKQLESALVPIDRHFGNQQPDFTPNNIQPAVYCYHTMFMNQRFGGDLAIHRGRYYNTIEFREKPEEKDQVVIKSELPGDHLFDYDSYYLRPLTDKERNNLEYIKYKISTRDDIQS